MSNPKGETTMTHTPGPWMVFVSRGDTGGTSFCPLTHTHTAASFDADDYWCYEHDVPKDEDGYPQWDENCDISESKLADAHLISAAPDMLAALQNILNGIETGVITSDHDETLANAADNARAAIAKAKKR